jgi:SAM-dependent methyltransferase
MVPMQPDDEIFEHYERTREADRLFSGPGELERIRTQAIITRYLVPPPARILDVGGGPGVYARWLLHEGYQVDLIDPVGSHVEEATRTFREERLPGSARRGDARRLDAEMASYDAVLLLGPLYHLPERRDRIQALLEMSRVLRPGGIAFLAAISRFASLLDGFARGFVRDPEFLRILTRDLVDGQHRNLANTDYFTTSFFHRPEEFAAEIHEAGLELELLAGVEGPFWCINGFRELWANASTRGLLLDFARQIESEPSLLGASAHWLAVVRRLA